MFVLRLRKSWCEALNTCDTVKVSQQKLGLEYKYSLDPLQSCEK